MASEQLREAIAQARRHLAKGDAHLANFVLRDLPETASADLDGLSWAMHREGCCSENDVLYLIEKLEEWPGTAGPNRC